MDSRRRSAGFVGGRSGADPVIATGETDAQYVERLESELDTLRARIDQNEEKIATLEKTAQDSESASEIASQSMEFLTEQLRDLALWITSPSAPRTKHQMGRLLTGLLDGEPWRNGGWKR